MAGFSRSDSTSPFASQSRLQSSSAGIIASSLSGSLAGSSVVGSPSASISCVQATLFRTGGDLSTDAMVLRTGLNNAALVSPPSSAPPASAPQPPPASRAHPLAHSTLRPLSSSSPPPSPRPNSPTQRRPKARKRPLSPRARLGCRSSLTLSTRPVRTGQVRK